MHTGLSSPLENSLVIIVGDVALHNSAIMQRVCEIANVELNDDDDEPEEPVRAADAKLGSLKLINLQQSVLRLATSQQSVM